MYLTNGTLDHHSRLKSHRAQVCFYPSPCANSHHLHLDRSGQGNISLQAALPLAKSLQREIATLGERIQNAATAQEASGLVPGQGQTTEARHTELLLIIHNIKELLGRIDRDIQYFNLAINASGESLSSSLSSGVSPSRLLQASTLLTFGDTQFAHDPTRPVQIGPSFALSLYMLFVGHAAQAQSNGPDGPPTPMTPRPMGSPHSGRQEPYGLGEGERRPIWQEVLHKARVRICRTPVGWKFDRVRGYIPTVSKASMVEAGIIDSSIPQPQASGGYAYYIEIIEDLDDGRLHDESGLGSLPFDNVVHAGIRESIAIPQISKIFYANTGRILNIGVGDNNGGESSPILLVKRDSTACNGGDEHWNFDETTDGDTSAGNGYLSAQQDEIDRQIQQESERAGLLTQPVMDKIKLQLPPHLDADWLAFEAFVEDDDDTSSGSEEEGNGDGICDRETTPVTMGKTRGYKRQSLDSRLVTQIRNISLREGSVPRTATDKLDQAQIDNEESFVARSPFGGIVSSLSLLEMLIRLTSLQEYEQKPHLTIHDPTLNFFLEETSTTGLRGEERWKARHEAKRRVGFDPYTDTPTK